MVEGVTHAFRVSRAETAYFTILIGPSAKEASCLRSPDPWSTNGRLYETSLFVLCIVLRLNLVSKIPKLFVLKNTHQILLSVKSNYLIYNCATQSRRRAIMSKHQGKLDGWLTGSSSRTDAAPDSANAPQPGTSRQSQSTPSGGKSKDEKAKEYASRKAALAAIARETRAVLPDILKHLPDIHASKSQACYLSSTPGLAAANCPRLPKVSIEIRNEDSYNVALSLAAGDGQADERVAVLNMASHSNPGGGWLSGASAQEEALCYRSSLALSLHRRYYPWKQRMGLYTPDVLVIRSDVPSGHKILFPDVSAADLPVVSVLSIAGIRCPDTKKVMQTTPKGAVERPIYKKQEDRDLTKDKMRLCLRMAAHNGHRKLVLGALGCGAFRNPKEEVAYCWREVLEEAEFQGGWWKALVFAVFDRRNEGNFEAFEDILGNREV